MTPRELRNVLATIEHHVIVPPNGPRLTLPDIANCFCEVNKVLRITHPQLKGTDGAKGDNPKLYVPDTRPLLPLVYPAKFNCAGGAQTWTYPGGSITAVDDVATSDGEAA
jgi:hypothetical protein